MSSINEGVRFMADIIPCQPQKTLEFGKRLKILCLARGWTVNKIAEEFGISPRTVSRWRDGYCPTEPCQRLMRERWGDKTWHYLTGCHNDPHAK
jgi:AraC-like DNA-binding protein